MIVATVIAVYLLAVLSFFVWASTSRDRLMRRTSRTTVVVTLKSGQAFKGILAEVDRQTVVLKHASALSRDAAVKADGEVILSRVDIDYIQRP